MAQDGKITVFFEFSEKIEKSLDKPEVKVL